MLVGPIAPGQKPPPSAAGGADVVDLGICSEEDGKLLYRR
jgi:hypothetical protein